MYCSYRIHVPQYATDAQFSRLLTFLKKHRSAIDELSLFTERWHHAYMPLDRVSSLADRMTHCIGVLRNEGFASIGINMLNTLGHIDEAWDFLPPWPCQTMISHDGTVSRCSPCPIDPFFLDYIEKKYATIARAKPDFIWIDDDLRMQSHGTLNFFGCFCPNCIRNAGFGTTTRDELVNRLNSPDGTETRQRWIDNNIHILDTLLQHIERAVHAVNPNIDIGLMTERGTDTYSGETVSQSLTTLRSRRIRPGGGFYSDHTSPLDPIRKMFHVARHLHACPPSVTTRLYEIENFPYQKLGKSITTLVNECTLALTVGCTGVAYNILPDLPGSLDDYDDLLAAITRERPRWTALARTSTADLTLTGLWMARDPLVMAHRTVANGNWFDLGQYDPHHAAILAQIGIPLTSIADAACGTIFCGRNIELFTDDQLREHFSHGVVMDTDALKILAERGLAEWAGVTPGRTFDNGIYERFTDHPLNGTAAGESRDVRISFWAAAAQQLIPIAPNVAELSRLIAYDDSDHGIGATAFTNALGGRVVVLGYAPWANLFSTAKRNQTIALADWISHNRLPLIIDRTLHVAPFVAMSIDRSRTLVTLLNASFDATNEFALRLRSSATRAHTFDAAGQPIALTARTDRAELHITIPSIAPWQTVSLYADA